MSVFFFVINRRRSLVGSPKYPTRREVLWAHIECTLGSMLYMLFISRTFFSLLVRSFSCVRPSSRDKFSVFMRSSPEKKNKNRMLKSHQKVSLSLFCVSHFTHSCFYYCHYPIAGNHGNTENLLLFSFISPSILWLGCWLRYNVSLHVSSRVSFSYSLACLCSDIRAESINIVFSLLVLLWKKYLFHHAMSLSHPRTTRLESEQSEQEPTTNLLNFIPLDSIHCRRLLVAIIYISLFAETQAERERTLRVHQYSITTTWHQRLMELKK